jgi:hypothetical protein
MISIMRSPHIRNLELNLLQPLRALLEERHITRAAEICYLSQPARAGRWSACVAREPAHVWFRQLLRAAAESVR